MSIIEKLFKRKLGRGGRHSSIFGLKTRSASSDDPQAARELLDEITDSTVLGDIENYEKMAREILANAGLPNEFPKTYDLPDGGKGTIFSFVEDKKLEPEWRAVNILFRAYATKEAIIEGDAEKAVYNAMRLESEVKLLVFSNLEHAARVGLSQLSCSTKYTDEDKADWESRAEGLKQDPKYNSDRKIAEKIAKDTTHGFESIRNHLATLK